MSKPRRLFHATDSRNRLAIRRYGLRARKPCEHNYLGEFHSQPEGVYGTSLKRRSKWIGRSIRYDIWEIACTGLPRERDPLINEGWVISCDVPPERLTLVEKNL